MPPKKKAGGKKGKAAADWGSDDDKVVDPLAAVAAGDDSDDAAPAPARPPPKKAAAAKKRGSGGGGGGAAAAAAFALLNADSDGGGDPSEDGASDTSDASEAPPKAPAFALPVEGEDEDEEEEGAVSPARPSAAAGFAALGLDDEGEDDEASSSEEEEEAAPAGTTGLIAARIRSVTKHPGADKLSVVEVEIGEGSAPPSSSTSLSIVTNAKEAAVGQVVVLAPAGVTTPGTGIAVKAAAVRGVASAGMLCCGADAGWCSEADGALARLAPDTPLGSAVPRTPPSGALYGEAALALAAEEKAARKAAKAAAKAAAGGDAPAPSTLDASSSLGDLAGAKKKKKKSASADVEAALAALAAGGGAGADGAGDAADAAAAAAAPSEEFAGGSKKPKKKSASSSAADVGALLAAIGGGEGGDPDTAAPPKKEKKEKKEKKDKGASSSLRGKSAEPGEEGDATAAAPEPTGDDEIDALLAAIDAPEPAAPAGGGGKKKKKKQGGAGAGGSGAAAAADDLDAALAELGLDVPATAAPAAADAPAAGAPDADAAADDDANGAPKELTAAQKKKLKAKAKAKARAARASEGGEVDDTPADDEAPDMAAPAAGGGGKGKKGPSAAVRRLQEELERRKAEAEAAAAEEAARIAAEEAAFAEAEAEAARKAADAEARKARQKERRAELKKAGLLLTGKAKAEAARLAAVREQFLREGGVALEEEGGGASKKKAVYEKKKKGPGPKVAGAGPSADGSAVEEGAGGDGGGAALSAAPSDAAASAAATAPEPSPSPPPASPSESEAEEDWDALDPEDVKLLPAAAAAKAAAEERARAAAGREKAAEEAEAARAALAAAQAEDDEDDDEDEDSDDDGGASSSGSDDGDGSSLDSDEELERRVEASKARRSKRFAAAKAVADPARLRAPIVCILGHVDTGKTKLLDNVRRTAVQEGEAGGITQQIGATYIPGDALTRRTAVLGARSLGGSGGAQAGDDPATLPPGLTPSAAASGLGLDLSLPGLLVIDTPGHESFSNLRSRGSGLCDIAILVVDLMHGLEPQTLESIALLKMRKTPFIIALNKVDRLFGWVPKDDAGFRDALASQDDHVRSQFTDRLASATLALNEQGLNVAPYWANPDPRKYVNIVPTSAISGEGVPDMLALLVKLTQTRMAERLCFVDEPQATVLEVKVIEGLGTTVDVVLVNGTMKEGDTVVACGLHGPLVATVRSLLTPHPLKELRVKGSYLHHKAVQAAQGVKIAAHGLESAVAGTQLLVVGPGDDLDALKEEAMEEMTDIFSSVDRTGDGVCAQASTLGSLEALLEFLKSPEVAIPVAGIAIGPVHKRDVMRASIMRERGVPKFACVLAFDVPVTREAGALAEELGVRVFTADIIYHLFDQFKAYLATCKLQEQAAARAHAAFPCVLKILPTCVFNKKDPIVLGVEVEEGIAAVGTPVCVPSREGGLDLGRIASLELNHKPVDRAHRGDSVAMKIEATCANENGRAFGRHFDATDRIVSRVTRKSIDTLKTHFREDLGRDDWVLVVKLKKLFGIE